MKLKDLLEEKHLLENGPTVPYDFPTYRSTCNVFSANRF
jgi:hypothetical protein